MSAAMAHEQPPVLVDPELDRRLHEAGYVAFPMLDAATVHRLRTEHAALAASAPEGLVIDFIEADRTVMRTTADLLAPLWEERLDGIFVDHQPVISTFVVKHPGQRSRMLLHCEPTYVDGDHEVFNIWIPLVDCDATSRSGRLRLIPRSERLPFGLMGFNTPVVFRPFEADLEAASVALDVPAGHAVIYNSKMLHWSEDNLSDQDRPAIAAAIAPRTAPMVHVVATGRSGRLVYAIDHDFFIDVHPTDVPERIGASYPLLREVVDDPHLDGEEVAHLLGLDHPLQERTVLPGKGLSTDPASGAVPELPHRIAEGSHVPVHDVQVSAASLLGTPEDGDPPGAIDVEFGSAAHVRTSHPALGAELSAALRRLADDPAASVLVLDAQTQVRVPAQPAPVDLVVYEAPRVAAGVMSEQGAATLEPTRAVGLEPGRGFLVWNGGPGPLVAVLAPLPHG